MSLMSRLIDGSDSMTAEEKFVDGPPWLGAATAPGGYAILSGLLNEQADEVRGAYEAAGFALVEAEQLGDWTTLTLQRR